MYTLRLTPLFATSPKIKKMLVSVPGLDTGLPKKDECKDDQKFLKY